MSAELLGTRQRRRSRRTGTMGNILGHTVLVGACVLTVVPFAWMVLTSLKSLPESTRVPPTILPDQFRIGNYGEVLQVLPFVDFFTNSVLMAACRTAGVLLLASMAGYAFARLRFPGRNALFVLVLSVMMVPPQVLLIPQYEIINALGWLNTIQALIAPGLFSGLATFLLRQFFAGLPKELEEAARLDGAGPFRIYWSVLLPLAVPGLLATGVLKTLWSWNELLWPLVVNSSPDKLTLSAGIAFMSEENVTNFPLQMAGATMAVVPMLLMFTLAQKHVVRGLGASTGMK